jgi:hypothetical protein
MQRNGGGGAWKAVEIGPERAGKIFQPVKCACLLKGFGIELDRNRRGIASGTAAGGLFFLYRMGSGIGAEEKLRVAAGGRLHQSLLVLLAFENRQAVEVRANSACQHVVTVEQQMMGSDGGSDIGGCRADERYRLCCGDMFQHNFQRGETGGKWLEYPLDENCFAVKNINVAIGYLAMYQEWYSGFLHGGEGVIEQAQIGMSDINKVVLAYSGGLDTSVIVRWLPGNYRCEVVTFTADIGQGEELEPARAKAQAMGVKEIFIDDLREEFVRDFVFPMFRANTIYEGEYLLGTSIARPLIAKRLVEIANQTGPMRSPTAPPARATTRCVLSWVPTR